MNNTNKILVILGPTSSGKSDIAIKLAKRFNGEVISADSRQIYRGMDIGTGKAHGKLVAVRPHSSLAARSVRYKIFLSHSIPHHLIDIISPRTNFNVTKFKSLAEKIIADILKRGKLPIICGGTGFWISAIVDNVNFPEVKPNWKLRKKLGKYSAEKLFAMLKKLDSQRAKNIDCKNKVRLIRAIEICRVVGKVPSLACHSDRPRRYVGGAEESTCEPNSYQFTNKRRSLGGVYPEQSRRTRNDEREYSFLQIGTKLPKEKLHQNIEKRVKSRFKQDMIKEVEKLHRQGLSWKKIQSFGLAYFWIPLYLQNKIYRKLSSGELRAKASKEKSLALEKKLLVEKVIQAEKNYAKRQMTWFRRDKRIKWLENYKKIENETKKFLK